MRPNSPSRGWNLRRSRSPKLLHASGCAIQIVCRAPRVYPRAPTTISSTAKPVAHKRRAKARFGLADQTARTPAGRNAFEEACRVSSDEQDPVGEGNALLGLAAVEVMQHRSREARPLYAKALLLTVHEGDSLVGQADVYVGLGTLEAVLGRTQEARSA